MDTWTPVESGHGGYTGTGWESPAEEARRRRADARWAASRRLVRRSMLQMPVNVPRFVEGAYRRGADAVMLDLEDSIPPSEKDSARSLIGPGIAQVGRGGADVIVKVNKPYELVVADLDVAVALGVSAIMFPKAESAREVAILDGLIGKRELQAGLPVGSINLYIVIETARGLFAVEEILAASDRIVNVDFGAEDFTRDLHIEPTVSGHELLAARQRVVQAARLTGVQPLGMATTLANYSDMPALRDSIIRAREMGFCGASCIHPVQVGVLNELFAPPAQLVDRARRVLAAFDAAVAAGHASASVDGQMVDIPTAERACALIERADAIVAHDARKREALRAVGVNTG